jgi:hypothetical protein
MREAKQKFSEDVIKEAQEILALYRFYRLDGEIYLSDKEEAIYDLFNAVTFTINECTVLKTHLPFMEFIHPSREVLRGDSGWVGHFKELDNCRFFLSDVYDFLKLFFGQKEP